jgi:hypothetical protein
MLRRVLGAVRPWVNCRGFCGVEQVEELLGHLVMFQGSASGGRLGVVRSAPRRVGGHMSTVPFEAIGASHGDDVALNALLHEARILEVQPLRSGSIPIHFPASSLDYVFFQLSGPPPLPSTVPQQIKELSEAFGNWIAPLQRSIIAQYADTSQNSAEMSDIDHFMEVLELLGKRQALEKLAENVFDPKTSYSTRTLLQFALYRWITWGVGGAFFQVVKAAPTSQFTPKAAPTFPISFALRTGSFRASRKTEIRLCDILEHRRVPAPASQQIDSIISQRVDLLKFPPAPGQVFTIDSNVNTVSEDAISLGPEEEAGRWVNVDILCASHHITKDSPLDLYAQELPLKVYMENRSFGMLPGNLCAAWSFESSQEFNKVVACLRFSALIHHQTGQVLEYSIAPKSIEASQIRSLSFQCADNLIRRKDGDGDLFELIRYIELLKTHREKTIKDISHFSTNTSSGANVLLTSSSTHIIREMMILAGTIAGNVASQLSMPAVFRESLGPVLSSYVTSPSPSKTTPTSSPHGFSAIGDLFFRHYAPVSSPLRKYTDLLNHNQLWQSMQSGSLLSEAEIQAHIQYYKRIQVETKSISKRDFRYRDLDLLNQEVGIGGTVVAEVLAIHEGVVSGKEAVQIDIRLEKYRHIGASLKVYYRPTIGERVTLRVTRLNVGSDILELSPHMTP